MRISEPGTARPQGFTLVELLVVLTIIGLMSAAVMLAVPDPRGTLRNEAERFAARVKAAEDQAVIGSRPLSVRVTAAGYGFDRREGGEWRPIAVKPFETQAWREGTQVVVAADSGARLIFDSTGISDPARIELARGGERIAIDIAQDGKIDVR